MLNSKISVHCNTDYNFVAVHLNSSMGFVVHTFNVTPLDDKGRQWSLEVDSSKQEQFREIAECCQTTTLKLRQRLVDEFRDKLKSERDA